MPDDGTLNDAIAEWARSRPNWEQTALGMLARGEPIDSVALERLADEAEAQVAQAAYTGAPLIPADLGPSGHVLAPVKLVAIREPRAVNALACEDGITFETDGITLIYGHNGSGKSGYARVLKTITRAREEIQVLGDIFAPEAEQSAEVSIMVGSDVRTLRWPADVPPGSLRQVSFYDSGCAGRYVSAETEVAYRPWTITLLDKLVSVSGQVRKTLESRRQADEPTSLSINGVDPASRPGQFLRSLSAATTPLELDLAQDVPTDVDERLQSLSVRIGSLRAQDPEGRKVALRQTLSAIETIGSAISETQRLVSKEEAARLKGAAERAVEARLAASRASELRFHGEPVAGIGDPAWMALWESARRFSDGTAYPEHAFPHTEDDMHPPRCVLCQQELDEDAKDRLKRFEEFVIDDTEDAARKAEAERDRLADQFRVMPTSGTPIALAVQRIESEGAALTQVRRAIQSLDERRLAVLEGLGGGQWPGEGGEVTVDLGALDEVRERLTDQLNELLGEDLDGQASALEAEERELQSRLALRQGRAEVLERIDRLKSRERLDEAIRLTDTRGITRRAAELTRSHVSDVMKHRFSQETLMLGLQRIRLGDAGGGQGNLRHRAQFVEALRPAPVHAVLSEGEQTALGLAGFLTEVESDPSRSAVVFDDPITSLDHVRQEKVAQRLVQLAASRQVVIFTHDIGFVVDLKRAAEEHGQSIAERQVSRRSARPGHVSEAGPWEGQTVGQRLAVLEERLAVIKSIGDSERQRDDIRHWYQDLRLAWERSLEESVLDKITARSRLELRPSGLEGIAQITEDDNREFQAAFTRCGDRGSHDRSTQLNRPTPPIEELREDLVTLRNWNKRVKAYR